MHEYPVFTVDRYDGRPNGDLEVSRPGFRARLRAGSSERFTHVVGLLRTSDERRSPAQESP
jgi:hypothetical protein